MEELIKIIEHEKETMKIKVVNKIIDMIEYEEFQNITDFNWVLSILKPIILNCPLPCERSVANVLKVRKKEIIGNSIKSKGGETRCLQISCNFIIKHSLI